MQNKDKKMDFDLSVLSLDELIKVYEEVKEFKVFLNDKILEEEKENDEDE